MILDKTRVGRVIPEWNEGRTYTFTFVNMCGLPCLASKDAARWGVCCG